jgi:hypothetical protein
MSAPIANPFAAPAPAPGSKPVGQSMLPPNGPSAAAMDFLKTGNMPKNPFASDRPEFERGTPKQRGFQETSADLEVENPFSR